MYSIIYFQHIWTHESNYHRNIDAYDFSEHNVMKLSPDNTLTISICILLQFDLITVND